MVAQLFNTMSITDSFIPRFLSKPDNSITLSPLENVKHYFADSTMFIGMYDVSETRYTSRFCLVWRHRRPPRTRARSYSPHAVETPMSLSDTSTQSTQMPYGFETNCLKCINVALKPRHIGSTDRNSLMMICWVCWGYVNVQYTLWDILTDQSMCI